MSIIDYIEISFIKGVGRKTIKKLQERFGSISYVLQNPEVVREQFGEKLFLLLKNRDTLLRDKALKELEKAEKVGAGYVTIEDDDYPPLLKEIPDPPPFLFFKGIASFKIPFISVVGSRKCSVYGKSIAVKVTEYLVENGIGVISGMASGIDAVVHSACLRKGGYTVGILGGGIDYIFPPENRGLYRNMEENGCLLSEFTVGTKPSKHTFPVRNRIIAGISYGTVVVEAGEKSGALITARLANDYGRVVFAVPSNINSSYGKGSNLLIKEGAVPVVELEDILENLPFLKNKKIKSEVNLSEIEKKIMNAVSHPVHIDMVAQITGIPVDKLSVILFEMEMKDLLTIDSGIVIKNV
ncbi:DNA-protecting protein DprA [Persephonella atlantica]|uniref:DNA-protecting protein DprA n=1 Tax=Persephonella atlantica TaxID=2699429 RepID=A0ABS1GJB6_9AQUI|nr:DNA-processing protein DprA [Persephonella atlantica]MBK3333024.1 DNA-protecting protein DprA [Persephonella atlantica]